MGKTANFLFSKIHPFTEQAVNKKKRASKHKLPRPSTIILSNNRLRSHRQRTHRYDLPTHSQSASPQSSVCSHYHHRMNVTPPPPSDHSADSAYYRRTLLLDESEQILSEHNVDEADMDLSHSNDEKMDAIVNKIDWENETNSDNSSDDDCVSEKLKFSMPMSESFRIPDGYLSHSIFVCPIQSEMCSDPQTKLGCGHCLSLSAFERLKSIQRARQHPNERQRAQLKIKCPNCEYETTSEKDVRYIYLGRFPNLSTDKRFDRILNCKDLPQKATKWLPAQMQINGQE